MKRIGYLAAAILCSMVVGACGKDPEVAKREYMQSGDRYVAQKKYQEAVIEYRNAVQQDPKFGEARYKLAGAYLALKDVRGAYSEYIRAADLLPKNIDAQIKATNMLLMARQFEDAKARVEKALAIDPRNTDALIARANAFAGLRNLDAAVTEVEEAIKVSPEKSESYSSLGVLELARGNREPAQAAFSKAIETDPKSVNARLAIANFYWSAGQRPEAEKALKEALTLDPKSILANRALAVFYIASGKPADAEPYLKAVADISGEAAARLMLADYYLGTGRIGEGKAVLENVAKTDPMGFSGATLRLAMVAQRAGDRPEAYKLIESILQKQPKDLDASIAKADLMLGDNRTNEALKLVQAAVAADPGVARAQFALGRVYMARKEWDEAMNALNEGLKIEPSSTLAQMDRARVSLATNKPDEALNTLSEVMKVQPRDANTHLLYARALMAKGDTGGAEPRMKQLAQAFPKSSGVQSQLGQLFAMKGDLKSARAAYESALAVEPGSVAALTGLAALDIQAKNPSAARQRIEARVAADPTNAPLLMLAGRVSYTTGDVSAAERDFKKVLELDSAQFDAYIMLANVYASQKRLDEAIAEYRRLATVRPKAAVGSQTLVGMILQMQGKPAEARKVYEDVMAIDSRAAVAANNLAWLYIDGGNLDVALQLAQTAKAQLNDRPEVNDTLGWIYYKKGLADLAVPPLGESVRSDPKNPIYQYHLGLAYAKTGDTPNAKRALQAALALKSDFEGAEDAKRVLRRFSTLIRVLAFSVIAVTLSWGFAWAAAKALVVQVSLPRTDALLVLSGAPVQRERTAYAARLFLAGRADKVIITDDGLRGAWSRALQKNPLSIERAVLQLTEGGVPRANIEILPGRVSSTHDEALRVQEYARTHPLKSLTVVTSMYHTRRALWMLRRVLGGSGTQVGIEPAEPGPLTPAPATWLWSARGWSAVAGEYLKLLYYHLHY